MVTLRYTAWDGSQRVRLSADQVFEKLAEHLSTTDDVQQAMDWLMRQGVEGENEKLKGLDDLVRDLREELRKRYRQFNLRSSLDELQQKLDDVLHQEKQTLAERRPQKPHLAQKETFLKHLPRRLSEQLEMLSRYEFEDAGFVVQRGSRLALSPKGVRRIGQLALQDIYAGLLRDRTGSHAADHRGIAEIKVDETRPYTYGDPQHLDLVGTLKKSLLRGAGVPLKLAPEDFTIFDTDHTTTRSTALLLDMSWSMSWEGRFAAAKKVALALESLIRTRYPRDYFSVVGFFTRAVELTINDLPDASWNM